LYAGTGDGGELTIEHAGGDTIDTARLTIVDDSGSATVTNPFATAVTAGVSETIDADADDTIRIIYTGDADDDDPVSATVATHDIR